jgi:hypothetical protein
MIIIPTTELIGCISDVLPIFTVPPKDNPLGGIRIAWDRESLFFTAYDVYTGAQVEWTPGFGAESDMENGPEGSVWDDDIAWGGDDPAWEVFIRYEDAKEILKLFKLPAKLWRTPVSLKVNDIGTKLIIERDDSRRGERLLVLATDNDRLRDLPPFTEWIDRSVYQPYATDTISFPSPARLGSFGAVRPHGPITFTFGSEGHPAGIEIGSRFRGFIFETHEKPQPYRLLRDGAGFLPGRSGSGKSEPPGTGNQNAD